MRAAPSSRRWSLALIVVVMAGCETASEPGNDPDIEEADYLVVEHTSQGLMFMTQNVVPEVTMEALYQGPVAADESGCLRLETGSDYGVTAVWPHGYTLTAEGEEVRVIDDDGAVLGSLGDAFEFGGGEVTDLLASLGFTDADRALAAARCPGRYWIVSDPGDS